ncbi:MAG: transposase [Bacteroidia bacterium]
MKYNPQIHHRKSIRLKGYDYSQAGMYFITICCHEKICRFGHILNNEMILNDAGKMVETEWLDLPNRFTNIQLHEFIVMPNHFHGILQILDVQPLQEGQPQGIAPTVNPENNVGAPLVGAQQPDGTNTNTPSKTVGDVMDAFKSITTVVYIDGVKTSGWERFNGKLWQRNYHEHIIRNEQSYHNIANYIINNAARWKEDKFYDP